MNFLMQFQLNNLKLKKIILLEKYYSFKKNNKIKEIFKNAKKRY